MTPPLARRALAEFLGSALLLVAVVGSGIAAETLSPTDAGLALLENAAATFGLLLVVFGVVRSGRSSVAPFAVGAYIAGAYFFTSSTGFANPAVTLARTLTDTFSGVAPGSIPGFVVAQLAGAALAVGAVRVLHPRVAEAAPDVVVPHHGGGGASAAVPDPLQEVRP